LKQHDVLYDWWQKFEAFVSFCFPDGTPLLHGLVKGRYPSLLVYFTAKVYPGQLSERDHSGRIPLHYAAEKPQGGVCSHGVTEHRSSFVILLAGLFPQGARYAGKNGKLPLTAYLEFFSTREKKPKLQAVMTLIKAAPQALSTRDPETLLMPFMIPAGNDTLPSLSTIYLILRENPAVVARAITDERELKMKVAYAEKKIKKLEEQLVEKDKELEHLEEENKKLRRFLEMKVGPDESTPVASKRARHE
jgi:uncharacterized coiled-coil protein SlyX